MKNSYIKNKNASVLLYAIVVLVLLGTIATYAMYYALQTQRISIDEFARIQLETYARSAAEFGVLWMQSGNPVGRSVGNVPDVNVTFDNIYRYEIYIHPVVGSQSIAESNGTVVMDIVGTINDMTEIDESGGEGTSPYRYTKRIVVKP